jgi:arginase family enzyme
MMKPPYAPIDSLQSPRFVGVRTFARLPALQTLEGVDFAIVGIPFDTGATFRVGARFGGPTSAEALALLRGLAGIHLVAADVVEVLPAYDPAGVTALLGANVAYELLSLLALWKQTHEDSETRPDLHG